MAARYRLDEEAFYRAATQALYGSGYIGGQLGGQEFRSQPGRRFDIALTGPTFAEEILKRFVLRPKMIQLVRSLPHAILFHSIRKI